MALERKTCHLQKIFPGFDAFKEELDEITGLENDFEIFDINKASVSNKLFHNDVEIEVISETVLFLYLVAGRKYNYLVWSILKVLKDEYGLENETIPKKFSQKWIDLNWMEKIRAK